MPKYGRRRAPHRETVGLHSHLTGTWHKRKPSHRPTLCLTRWRCSLSYNAVNTLLIDTRSDNASHPDTVVPVSSWTLRSQEDEGPMIRLWRYLEALLDAQPSKVAAYLQWFPIATFPVAP